MSECKELQKDMHMKKLFLKETKLLIAAVIVLLVIYHITRPLWLGN